MVNSKNSKRLSAGRDLRLSGRRLAGVSGVSGATWARGALCVPAATVASIVAMFGVTATVTAQQNNSSYGLPPSSATQRTLSPPEEIDGRILPGFYPGISIIATRHSNARRVTSPEESDTEISVSPELVYRAKFGANNHLELGYTATANQFSNFSDEDTDAQGLSAAVQLNIGRNAAVDLRAGYNEGSEARGSSAARAGNDAAAVPDEYKEQILSVDGRLGNSEDRLQFGVGASAQDLEYTNNNQSSRDRDNTSVYGRVTYNVSPLTSVLAEIRQTDVDYIEDSNPRDSQERTLTVGANWQPTELTGFQFRVGKTQKDFDNESLQDFDGTNYLGRVTWEPTAFTTVSAYASRAVEESSDSAASFFVSDLIGVTVNHGLSERLNLLGYYNKTEDDFSNGRLDDVKDYGVGLDYAMREWLSLNARIGRVKRTSNEADVPFEDTFVSLGISAKRKEPTRK